MCANNLGLTSVLKIKIRKILRFVYFLTQIMLYLSFSVNLKSNRNDEHSEQAVNYIIGCNTDININK